jgi:hypothetical protein
VSRSPDDLSIRIRVGNAAAQAISTPIEKRAIKCAQRLALRDDRHVN